MPRRLHRDRGIAAEQGFFRKSARQRGGFSKVPPILRICSLHQGCFHLPTIRLQGEVATRPIQSEGQPTCKERRAGPVGEDYLNFGDGYHSNDARGVTRSGENPGAPAVTPLTRVTGGEIGLSSQPVPSWETTLDVFQLKLKSELVFSGDAGVTSPSGSTTRTGIEWGNTYNINRWLSAELSAAFTKARIDQDAAPDDLGCGDADAAHPCSPPVAIVGRYIPNSPTNVIDAGLSARRESGWFGALRAWSSWQPPLDRHCDPDAGQLRSGRRARIPGGGLVRRSASGRLTRTRPIRPFNAIWNSIPGFGTWRSPRAA